MIIRTRDGSKIRVEDGVDQGTIDALKTAKVVKFQEFVYTGNHPNGDNSGNYEDLEEWLTSSGLKIVRSKKSYKEDDMDILLWNLEKQTGIAFLQHRGKTMRYHVQSRQARRGDSNQFGYTYRVEYRLISVS